MFFTRKNEPTSEGSNNKPTSELENTIKKIHEYQCKVFIDVQAKEYQDILYYQLATRAQDLLMGVLLGFIQSIIIKKGYESRTNQTLFNDGYLYTPSLILLPLFFLLRNYRQRIIAPHEADYTSYCSDCKKARDMLEEMQGKFGALSEQDKERLVTQSLATKDATGTIHLNYSCPISLGLIFQPIEVIVRDQAKGIEYRELYNLDDKNLLLNYLKDKLSPKSRLPIMKYNFSPNVNQEILANLLNLENELNKLSSLDAEATGGELTLRR